MDLVWPYSDVAFGLSLSVKGLGIIIACDVVASVTVSQHAGSELNSRSDQTIGSKFTLKLGIPRTTVRLADRNFKEILD